MLTALAPRTVQTSGTLDSRAFTIKPSGKAFKALINSMYPDKIKAPLRELWSNAYDAHVAAGIGDEPFECQLPTVFDPVFRVKDRGVSMSHEDVMGLYSVLFESSKEYTDTQVGKWGLGSKSPFAYVDTFTVTAWLAGEKRMYSAYIGEDHVPRIDLMLREPSDEPTGFEVQFPVKADDVDAFASAANKVALGFKVLPTLTGRQVKFTKLAPIMEDDGLWALCKADEGYFNTGMAYARLGCVVYPIDVHSIPSITGAQESVLRSPFFIEFSLSDCDITINREALDYTEKTIANIQTIADIIAADVRDRYTKQTASCRTYWEACCAYVRLQTGGLHSSLKALLTEGLTWRGRQLTDTISLQSVLRRQPVHATHFSPSTVSKRRQLKWDPTHYINGYRPASTAVYFEDSRAPIHHGHLRIRHHFDDRRARSEVSDSLIWIKADPTSRAWKRLYCAMGRPPTLVNVATLPKAPVDRYHVKKPTRLKVFDGSKFTVKDVDEDDNVFYVEMDRAYTIGPKGEKQSSYRDDTGRVQRHLIKLGGYSKDMLIVGVPRSCKKVAARNPHWRLLWDVARETVASGFDPVRAARAEKCVEIADDDEFEMARRLAKQKLFPTSTKSPMAKYLALHSRIIARAEAVKEQRAWYDLASTVLPNVTLPRYDVRFQPLVDKMKETYPMLVVASYINEANLWLAVDYVNLVDKCAECVHSFAVKPETEIPF